MSSKIVSGFCVRAAWCALGGLFFAAAAFAQDVTLGVTYVCSGERMFVENCNIRDMSDAANCMVGHPDHVGPNGLMQYTYMTRGALKKLLPTCTQPTAAQVAAAKAMQKRQQDIYNANVQKNEEQMRAPAQPVGGGGVPPPSKDPETRAMNRCVTAGRPPSSCMGNALLGGFSKMLNSVVQITKDPEAGLSLLGAFAGAGGWRIEFQDDGNVLMSCSGLIPNGRPYSIAIRNNHAVVTIDSRPKPFILTFKGDDVLLGPGPMQVEGPVGTTGGSQHQYRNENGLMITQAQAAASSGPVYDETGQRVYSGSISADQGHFIFRTVSCAAPVLSSKGAGTGIQQMQINVLKSMVGGDDAPPPPAGLRMRGIFASAETGFSAQFFPESVVLGCGPDAARAYPYTVVADGTKAVIAVKAPDHPLEIAFGGDGSLDAGAGMYQVHGRYITGQNGEDDFTFGPMERTCALGVLRVSKEIPTSGGSAASAAPASGAGAPANNGGTLSTPQAPLGNATLAVVSGLPAQAGVPNPLAMRPYILLRDSYANVVASGGATVPAGVSPYVYAGRVCAPNAPGGPAECGKINAAVKASAASAVRADANGSGTFPGVPPGTYYLMISARYDNHIYVWGRAVALKPGANTVKLELKDATPLN